MFSNLLSYTTNFKHSKFSCITSLLMACDKMDSKIGERDSIIYIGEKHELFMGSGPEG